MSTSNLWNPLILLVQEGRALLAEARDKMGWRGEWGHSRILKLRKLRALQIVVRN